MKLSIEEIKNRVETKGAKFIKDNGDGTFLLQCKCGEYINRDLASIRNTKLNCKKCQNKDVAKKQTYTDDELKSLIFETYGDSVKFIGTQNIPSGGRNVRLVCSCGREFIASFAKVTHKIKTQCRTCTNISINRNKKYTTASVKRFIETESGCGCKLISGEYENYKSKLMIQCKCGNIFSTSFEKFMLRDKRQCNSCGDIRSATTRYQTLSYTKVKKFIEENTPLKLISPVYLGHQQPIELKCPCGKIFTSNWRNVSAKKIFACPECRKSTSRGELRIKQMLDKYNIEYKQQYQFKDLTGPYHNIPLKFDFAVFENGELVTLLEFDGMQHFYPVEYWGGQEKFEILQKHDSAKNEYCKEHNYNLFRIHYKYKNKIEEVLLPYLKSLNMSIPCQD